MDPGAEPADSSPIIEQFENTHYAQFSQFLYPSDGIRHPQRDVYHIPVSYSFLPYYCKHYLYWVTLRII